MITAANDSNAAASSESEMTTTEMTTSIVLESLLALAKDHRYLQECQSRCLDALLHRQGEQEQEHGGSINRNHSHQLHHHQRAQALSLLASSFWMAMVVWRKGGNKTLGMEACGIQYCDTDHQLNQSSSTTSAFSCSSKWRATTAWILTAIVQWYILHPSFSFSSSRQEEEEESLSASSSASVVIRRTDETLRGSRRRQYHEQQRRAMLERSSARSIRQERPLAATSPPLPPTPLQKQQLQQHKHSGGLQVIAKILGNRLRREIRRLVVLSSVSSSSLSSSADQQREDEVVILGPHAVWDPASRHHQQQTTMTTTTINTSPLLSVGAWILRLHLALYCLDGRFPSWWHRMFRLPLVHNMPHKQQHSTKDNKEGDGRLLVHRPMAAPRIVGLLILAQALGASVPALAKFVIRTLIGSRRPTTTTLATSTTRQQQTGIPFTASLTSSSSSSLSAAVANSTNTNSMTTAACLICRQPRTHPACPPCGHVFCWTCLQQWFVLQTTTTTTNQQHSSCCPYCRTPCRPQEVLALYKYQ